MEKTIHIDDDFMTLQEIKDQFSARFPHLKIEFFERAHRSGEGSTEKHKIDPAFRLRDIRKEGIIDTISVHGNLKTRTLESQFAELYGAHVQVYKKQGDTWIQTTATDDWTLAEQEKSARASSQ
ncbi:MAG: hypothetical protein ACQERC_01500 [Bacteroidota bacterium]